MAVPADLNLPSCYAACQAPAWCWLTYGAELPGTSVTSCGFFEVCTELPGDTLVFNQRTTYIRIDTQVRESASRPSSSSKAAFIWETQPLAFRDGGSLQHGMTFNIC